jgi:hypothetical protein
MHPSLFCFTPGWSQFTILGLLIYTIIPSLLRWALANFLSRLALNCNPPNLYLLSTWNYKHEQSHPTQNTHLFLRSLVYFGTRIRSQCNRRCIEVLDSVLNRSITINEIKSAVKSLPKKKRQGANGFLLNFNKYLKNN